jgi:hypothetical protein
MISGANASIDILLRWPHAIWDRRTPPVRSGGGDDRAGTAETPTHRPRPGTKPLATTWSAAFRVRRWQRPQSTSCRARSSRSRRPPPGSPLATVDHVETVVADLRVVAGVDAAGAWTKVRGEERVYLDTVARKGRRG